MDKRSIQPIPTPWNSLSHSQKTCLINVLAELVQRQMPKKLQLEGCAMNTETSQQQLNQWDRIGKITAHHLDRKAIIYIRQSTLQQVQRHQESTKLQYNLVDRALLLG